MDELLVVQRETQIAAPPATVFAFLTDPQKILSWMGAEATTDAHPGGLYLVKDVAGRPGRTARGQFREVVPVHRLAYSFGWDGRGCAAGVEPGRDRPPRPRRRHARAHDPYWTSDAAECAGHAKGWATTSAGGVAAAGGNPGVDRGPAGHA